MKYQITPFTLAVGATVFYALYSLVITPTEDKIPLSFAMIGFLVPTLILAIGADMIMQKFIGKTWMLYTVQMAILSGGAAYFMFGQATRTLVIPDQLASRFIIVVYGVEDAEPLPQRNSFELPIPDDGVLFTSTAETDSNLGIINQMKTTSGKKLDYLTGDSQWHSNDLDSVEVSGKKYFYRQWTHRSVDGKPDNDAIVKLMIQNKMNQPI